MLRASAKCLPRQTIAVQTTQFPPSVPATLWSSYSLLDVPSDVRVALLMPASGTLLTSATTGKTPSPPARATAPRAATPFLPACRHLPLDLKLGCPTRV